MPLLDEPNSASLLILSVAFGLTLIVIVMYFLWQKFRNVKRKRSTAYESKEELNITTLSVSRHMSYPSEIKTEGGKNSSESPTKTGSITPPPPARSFSGQFDIKKISPSMRHLSKINSQIIMFNGQPHIHSQLHRRFSKADILESAH